VSKYLSFQTEDDDADDDDVKVKVTLERVMKAQKESRGIALIFL
jgi:hypothetical protein